MRQLTHGELQSDLARQIISIIMAIRLRFCIINGQLQCLSIKIIILQFLIIIQFYSRITSISKIMTNRVFVVGVGLTPFMKASTENPDYPELASTAINRALKDAEFRYNQIQAVIAGFLYGDSTSGQRAVYQVGMTGVPIYNINNNGATGATAIQLAFSLINGGVYSSVLAFGFEKMEKGSLKVYFNDRTQPTAKFVLRSAELFPSKLAQLSALMVYSNAGLQHNQLYGTTPEHFEKIAAKNHRNAAKNPYALFKKGFTLADIKKSNKVHQVITKFQCSSAADGAGAIILCNEATMLKMKRQNQAVEILAIQMATDTPQWSENAREVIGYSMTKNLAQKVYKKAGVKPAQIDVAEVHDCFSPTQLIAYEALQFCEEGKGGQFVDRGQNDYGGQVVVNTSGGLIGKGHPISASGFAQCSQLCWQLRGIAGKRQVQRAKVGLQHSLGLGGACVIGIYRKYNDAKSAGTSELSDIIARQQTLKIRAKL